MAPSLQPGDGFVAIPAAIASTPTEGDVITFRADEVNGGGLTTHRIVGRNERGYITKGDANPVTDQDGYEPPVKDPQIVAKAVQINGQLVVIPDLGTAIEAVQATLSTVQRRVATLVGFRSLLGAQGLAYIFFATTVVWYLLGLWRESDHSRSRDRTRDSGTDTRLLAAGFAALLVTGATAAMVAPAGTQEFGVVSAEFESEQPTVIPAGESNDVTYPVSNGGALPIITYLEPASDGVAVEPGKARIESGGTVEATVIIKAPPETGYYRRFLVEHRYLALLPGPVIDALYEVHPWLPILAIDTLLGVPFYLVAARLLGGRRVRTRSRDGPSRLSLFGRS
jgi:signal peptidase